MTALRAFPRLDGVNQTHSEVYRLLRLFILHTKFLDCDLKSVHWETINYQPKTPGRNYVYPFKDAERPERPVAPD